MKTSQSPSKNFSQKGAGLLEYALLFGFVAAVFLVILSEGSFGDTIGNLFGSSGDSVASVEFNGGSSGGYGSSSGTNTTSASDFSAILTTSEILTAEESTPVTYKTLNWQEIDMGVQAMYSTVLRSDTPDKALTSETNLFGEIMKMTEGYLASTNAADGTKDWEKFLSTVENFRRRNNFSSSYQRGEENLSFQRLGNSNTFQVKYSDKENVIYYRLSPDANNVMQVETNSHKSYSEFFASIVKEKGWEYSK